MCHSPDTQKKNTILFSENSGQKYLGRDPETLKMFQKCYTPDGGRHTRAYKTRRRTLSIYDVIPAIDSQPLCLDQN